MLYRLIKNVVVGVVLGAVGMRAVVQYMGGNNSTPDSRKSDYTLGAIFGFVAGATLTPIAGLHHRRKSRKAAK